MLELPLAGPTSRMLAYGIDLVLVLFLALLVALLLLGATRIFSGAVGLLAQRLGQLVPNFGNLDPQHATEATQLLVLVLFVAMIILQLCSEMLYFVFFETVWRGQTPGKRAMGLRVVGDHGAPLTLMQSLTRNLLRLVDILPGNYVIGLISMLVARDSKRLGDIVAGTVVIRLDRPQPALAVSDEPHPGDDTFIFDAVPLRAMGPNEMKLIRQTLRRLDSLTTGEAEALLALSVGALAPRLGYADIGVQQRAAFLRALHRSLTVHQ